jgi:HAD superfamily hydrolase (TIGR01509 family)
MASARLLGEKAMSRLQGVLLDVDGTLVDSNDAHAKAWVQALEESGVAVHSDKVRKLIGKGGDKLLPEAVGIDAYSAKGKRISQRRGEIFERQFLPKLQPFPGARYLLVRMKQQGLRLAVASSAKKDELNGLLQLCNVQDLLEKSTSSDDALSSKPSPDIVQAALAKNYLRAGETILLGDTPYDIEAARQAGVRAVALRCGGWSNADLSGALAIYDNPIDLLSKFDQSPFAKEK